MEFEPIAKHVEWLDEQQRQNKLSIEDLGNRLTSLETSVNALNQLVRGLTKELGDLSTAAARLDQFDQIMTKHRSEVSKALEAAEKRALKREQDAAKLHRAEISELRRTLTKLMDEVGPDEIERKFRERTLEQQRLNLAVQDLRAEVEGVLQKNKELLEAQRVMDESQRQNTKRLTDLQGEFTAVRKRVDEMREKTVLHADNLRNLENRLNELVQSEAARQDAQASFLQEQMAAQAERDRAWREWREKYEIFKKQAETIEAQVMALDEAVRAAKHAQETYSELNQKLEKRIAEISEVQRLAEDRFRQEWAAFKAEEQKRWTNFSLGQEEALREVRKSLDKMEQSVVALNDASQTLHDQLHQTTDTTEKQLQELMNIVGDWVAAYEHIMGHHKTKARRAVR